MKDKEKDKKKIIKRMIILCSILIVCLLLLLFVIQLVKPKEPKVEMVTQEERKESMTDYVRNRNEKERMQVYLAEYLKHLERREYELAYDLLYPQFKQNYFPSKEAYIDYVKTNYSDLMMVNYEDIQRQGNYYILTVTITNLGEMENTISQKFILYENGLNDYTLSFQVK